MLMCDKTVTLVHHNKGVDGDEYICTVLHNASWFKKITIATTAEGAKPVNTFECRVMGQNAVVPALGDYVVLGEVGGIEKPADLKNLDCFRITALGANQRGNLPHWRLSGQ